MWRRALASIAVTNSMINIFGVRCVFSENVGGKSRRRDWLLSLSWEARSCAICDKPLKAAVVLFQNLKF
jgi:hypothetical protein